MENATPGAREEELNLDDLIKEEARKKTRKIAYFSIISIVLIGTASFGLGRLTKVGGEREPIRIELPPNLEAKLPSETPAVLGATSPASANLPAQAGATEGAYVASKSGTKYHLPWCGSAKSIKEENKIWFDTKEAAEAAGYTPASNCKGI